MRKRKQRDKYPVKGSLIELKRLARELGASTKTLRRWRKKGWLETVPRGRHLMVTGEMVERFLDLMKKKGFIRIRIVENRDWMKQRNPWDR